MTGKTTEDGRCIACLKRPPCEITWEPFSGLRYPECFWTREEEKFQKIKMQDAEKVQNEKEALEQALKTIREVGERMALKTGFGGRKTPRRAPDQTPVPATVQAPPPTPVQPDRKSLAADHDESEEFEFEVYSAGGE